MEITKREIIASISILAVFLILGILISSKISDSILDKNEKYYKALKIDNKELFEYGMNTSVGNAFVYGDLNILDPVSYPEIGGEYAEVKKVKERYTKHTRTVTYTDSKGKTQVKTETYWSWDVVGSESITSTRCTFLGVDFDYSKFDVGEKQYIKTINDGFYVRYKYYGTPINMTGTIFTKLTSGSIEGEDITFYINRTINETIDYLESNYLLILFWVLWIPLTGFMIYKFCYLDNKWLND